MNEVQRELPRRIDQIAELHLHRYSQLVLFLSMAKEGTCAFQPSLSSIYCNCISL